MITQTTSVEGRSFCSCLQSPVYLPSQPPVSSSTTFSRNS
jgi:hypothetical protein